MTDAAQLSTLALDVWRFGLAERGEHLFAVVRRLERELGQRELVLGGET